VVRTGDFKEWFGDWERVLRIEKLENAPDLVLDGNAYQGKYDISGTPKENKVSIEKYLKTLKDLKNDAIDGLIKMGSSGIDKITSYGMSNPAYMKSIAHIPDMLKNAVFITEESPRKAAPHYLKFRHLVTGIEIL
jgi:hypothetical protein